MNDYDVSLDIAASDIRTELSRKIQEVVNSNQESFIAHWIKQHPDTDFSTIRLCHSFRGNYYQFWIEEKDNAS